jgi:hypothetical protein
VALVLILGMSLRRQAARHLVNDMRAVKEKVDFVAESEKKSVFIAQLDVMLEDGEEETKMKESANEINARMIVWTTDVVTVQRNVETAEGRKEKAIRDMSDVLALLSIYHLHHYNSPRTTISTVSQRCCRDGR